MRSIAVLLMSSLCLSVCRFQNCSEDSCSCKTPEENINKACRKYFTFCKQGEQVCFLTTLLFLPKLHCCSILFCPARFRKTFRVSKATFMFILCRTESDLQRRHVFTFGSIQCAYSVLENSPLGSPRNSSRERVPAKIHKLLANPSETVAYSLQ